MFLTSHTDRVGKLVTPPPPFEPNNPDASFKIVFSVNLFRQKKSKKTNVKLSRNTLVESAFYFEIFKVRINESLLEGLTNEEPFQRSFVELFWHNRDFIRHKRWFYHIMNI